MDAQLLNQWIGKTETVEDVINLAPARAMAAMLDHEKRPRLGDELPPLWSWSYFLPAPRQSFIGEDGHPQKGGFLPPVPLPQRLRAGGYFKLEAPLRIGDSARQVQTVKDIKIKEGRSGTLIFVTVQYEIFAADERALVEEMHLVYRDRPGPDAGAPPPIQPPQNPEWNRRVTPDPVLLFRYSALTMNTHRIHYDRTYAISEEGHRGLVVQAPLTATLLLDLMHREAPNLQAKSINFRATCPLYDGWPIGLEGKRVEDGVLLWAVDHEGALAMKVEVGLV